ncbi:hypothetical protein AA0472_0600 [Acetobacter estunensis NRIC 0472]|uniref:MOSC domain-containing protein n=1 Tax=Acetobacter estunensis TaxID=104097 RepID=A0A967B9K7_9PROT|nr:MOSC N-terminal beta barrel domain-containing protein [Acetobacter estunensis]NHO54481.1 MOSC domain-containing protein [Acetobacter estunensis]GBQ21917.1 hypothetical protein AA0472_0600 [Acetobacter estunensis NRIC 0472]
MLRIASLHIYPVKGLHALSLEQLELETWGPLNDRRWLVVTPKGEFLTQRTMSAMARIAAHPSQTGVTLKHTDGTEHVVPYPVGKERDVRVWVDTVRGCDAGDEVAEWLSAHLGRACRLVFMIEPRAARLRNWQGQDYPVSFADEFPVLLCTEASLVDLNTRLAMPVPMARFRPNLVVTGASAWEEDAWVRLGVGDVELRLVKPCSRCVVTTIDQETGQTPEPGQPLKALAEFRHVPGGVMFGQNALVEKPGMIRVGDEVRVIERRA